MTGTLGHALRAAAVAIVLVLAGCGPASAPSEPPPQAVEPGIALDPEPVDYVLLESPGDLAAQAPLGRLRVARAVQSAADGASTAVFQHLRGDGAPDLLLSVTGGNSELLEWSASPGRLTAAAADGALFVAAAAGRHDALYRFVVPPGESLHLVLDWHGGEGSAEILERSLVAARGRRDVTGILRLDDGKALHVVARFDRAFAVVDAGVGAERQELRLTPPEGVVHLRLALSTVDLPAARAQIDNDGFDFATQHATVRAAWNRLLQRVAIEGDEALRTSTATSLFRVLAHYGDGADRDGRYRAADGSLRRMPAGAAFIDALDLEREQGTVLPLLSLVAPEWMSGFAESLLAQKRMNGHLPDRVRNGSAQTGSTLAPALPVLASMVATGAPGVEPARILPSMLKDVSIPKGDWPWADFQALGYFPYDRVDGRSVLLTLEASRAHRAVAGVAAVLGDRDVAAEHATRTLFYRQLFRAEAVRFCARNHLGTWRAECTLPTDVGARNMNDGQRAAEAALWAPARFDVDGLITLLGGRQALAERLALLFDAGGTGTDPGIRYEHDDPGLHHVPWLFAYSNSPERTVSVVRRVLETAGPVTTESVEQSAWRVFAILGFYPVLHGQGEYVLGTPLVTEARIETGDRVLRIERGVADTPGVTHPISLDGVPLPGRTLGHRRLTQGSILRFVGSNPGNP